MSWSIYKEGTREEALGAIQNAQCYEQVNGQEGTGNEAQFNAAKALLKAEVEALPANSLVIIKAGGHVDAGDPLDARRQFSITFESTPPPRKKG